MVYDATLSAKPHLVFNATAKINIPRQTSNQEGETNECNKSKH